MAAVPAAYAAASAVQVATVASTAISIAATIQAVQAAKASANAQEAAAKKRNEQLVEQTVANYGELSEVELDAHQHSLDSSLEVQKDTIQQKGRVNVMAAAMGTGGQSVQSQLSNLERDKYSNYSTILQNRQTEFDNVRAQASNARFSAANNMDVKPISRPSYAAAALNIGTTALTGYTQTQTAGAASAQLSSGG